MERLRDVLNGTWAGNYTYNSNKAFRPETRMEITSQISPNTGNLEVNGSGRDGFGFYTLKGSAKSPTEISCVKSFGRTNEWWHTATVDIDGRQMNGRWGPARAPNQVNGTFLFRRQITEADRQREEAAAAQKKTEEARKREEEAAAVTAKKKQEEEEEAAKKKQEEEEAEAARKQKEEAEAAKKRTEEAEAAKKQEEAERARQQAADAEKKQKEAEDKRKEAERSQSMQEAARPRPQDTAPATKQKGKPISSQDSEDDVAGNSKVYLKVDLDADVRVIAALKGDVAVGIL